MWHCVLFLIVVVCGGVVVIVLDDVVNVVVDVVVVVVAKHLYCAVCVWHYKQYLDTDHGTRRPGLSDNSLLS